MGLSGPKCICGTPPEQLMDKYPSEPPRLEHNLRAPVNMLLEPDYAAVIAQKRALYVAFVILHSPGFSLADCRGETKQYWQLLRIRTKQ